LSDPNPVTDPNAVTFDLDDNDTHIWVNEDDVGLVVLVAPSHSHIGHNKPIAKEGASEAVNNDALGIVLQQFHWEIFRDELPHYRLFRLAVPAETATSQGRRKQKIKESWRATTWPR
jgi:hypothetical protein